tara:strand:+ start:1183 stop:1368 length:186 start_codon:yes stop_codon:yes gene_type:complete
MKNLLKKIFKKRHPYAPVAFLGKKAVEGSMGCKVVKTKKLYKMIQAERADGKVMPKAVQKT